MRPKVSAVPRVVLCDDHVIVREAIKVIAKNSGAFTVVGEAGDGREVVEIVAEFEPDVLVIEIDLPRCDGIEATKAVLQTHPRTKVLVYSAHAHAELVTLALRAGASGFVSKSAPVDELSKALMNVCRGSIYLGGGIDATDPAGLDRLLKLTAREREILILLSNGLRAREIADILTIRPGSVHTHVRNAIGKLEARTRTEAVALAVRFAYLGPNRSH